MNLPNQLERAEAGSGELDALIWWKVDCQAFTAAYWNGALGLPRPLVEMPSINGMGGQAVLITAPRYTTSIDAALTLVPEGFEWSLSGEETEHTSTGIPWLYCAELGDPLLRIQGDAATPALALCAAALRAHALASKDAGL